LPIGKSITIFLIDGVPEGRLSGELSNWTGKAIKIPRRLLKESAQREELSRTGVYFLFGKDENNPEGSSVYIGEGEDVYKRLLQHQKWDFWTEAVVLVSKDENLNKAHIKYLESSLYNLASKAKRYTIKNANITSYSAISELEKASMIEFIENLKILINTMGFKLFEPLTGIPGKRGQHFFIKATRGANAKALLTSEGIVVIQGSEIAASFTPSAPKHAKMLRQKLVDQGIIIQKGEKWCFFRDHLFSSPSTAANVVMGKSANGRIQWKDKNGRSLKDLEEL